MLVDWFTVIAQLVNFLILAGLLKRILYRPIQQAIDVREQSIAKQITKAQIMYEDAAKQKSQYETMFDSFEQRCQQYEIDCHQKVERECQFLLEENQLKLKQQQETQEALFAKNQLEAERVFLDNLRQQLPGLLEQTLMQLADVNLMSHVLDVFLDKLDELMAKEPFLSLSVASGTSWIVSTSHPLSDTEQQNVFNCLQHHFGQNIHLQFTLNHALFSGIELQGHGYSVSWSLQDYLYQLTLQLQRNG